jgi:hypothetical protein
MMATTKKTTDEYQTIKTSPEGTADAALANLRIDIRDPLTRNLYNKY